MKNAVQVVVVSKNDTLPCKRQAKNSPRLGPKPYRGTSNFSISPVCSKKFKYLPMN